MPGSDKNFSGNSDRAKKASPLPTFLLDDSPIKEVHAFWLAGMSCDGCSIATVGA